MQKPNRTKIKILLALGYAPAGTRRASGPGGEGRLFAKGQEFARVDGDQVLLWRMDGSRVKDWRYVDTFCLERTLRARLGLEPMAETKQPEPDRVSGVYPVASAGPLPEQPPEHHHKKRQVNPGVQEG